MIEKNNFKNFKRLLLHSIASYIIAGTFTSITELALHQVQKPSKPFVITSIIMLLLGSVLGALWMMTLYGVPLPAGLIDIVRLHRSVQFDGFITMLIMGIGYMSTSL